MNVFTTRTHFHAILLNVNCDVMSGKELTEHAICARQNCNAALNINFSIIPFHVSYIW